MSDAGTGAVGLLHRAAGYALGAVDTVTPECLSRPTPCQDWNLEMLLGHASESVAALHEGLDAGRIGLFPADHGCMAVDPARSFRLRLVRLLHAWTSGKDRPRAVEVAGRAIPPTVLTCVAALEITVHGWDIGQASGHHEPIPSDLALALLPMSELLVPDGCRHPLFAAPVLVRHTAGPSERLLAFLGRSVPTPESERQQAN